MGEGLGRGWADEVGGFAAYPSPGTLRVPTSPTRGEVIFSAPPNIQ